MGSDVRYIHGHMQLSPQLFEQMQRDESSWKRLEWIATHYDEATDLERADLDRTLRAIDDLEDD